MSLLAPGTRVRLVYRAGGERYGRVPLGTVGTVIRFDHDSVVMVRWDNGAVLGLLKNLDRFEIVNPKGDTP